MKMKDFEDGIEKKKFSISIGVFIIMFLFIISQTYNITAWKTQMEEQYVSMSDKYQELLDTNKKIQSDIRELDIRQNQQDVSTARIETKLDNIENLLVNINRELRNNR